jgi:hypothetical protein
LTSHSQGVQVAGAGSTWSESTTTYSNRPSVGSVLGSTGPLTAGTTVDVDVTSYVTGNGQVDLALLALNSTALAISSREGVAPPQLLIVQSGGSNRAPTAGDTSLTVAEDAPATTWAPVVSDPDGAAGLSCSISTPAAHGTATVAPDCSGGTYAPAADYNGSDTVTYQVSDGIQTDTGSVAVTVTPVPDAPVADAASATTSAGTPTTVSLAAHDVDGQCPLSFAVVSGPAHGALGALATPTCSNGSATTRVTYTPAAGYTGPDTFTFAAGDGTSTSPPATVSISVGAGQGSATFTATEDAYVVATSSGSNYGTSAQLRVDNSPDIRSYLRFQVTGLNGTVTSTVLRLYVGGNNSAGFEVHRGSTGWSEGLVTYANAPAPGALLASSGGVTKGQWVEIPLDGLVSADGQVDLVLVALNGTNLPLASRETTTAPQLVVRTG